MEITIDSEEFLDFFTENCVWDNNDNCEEATKKYLKKIGIPISELNYYGICVPDEEQPIQGDGK